jgi:hypothetical protein
MQGPGLRFPVLLVTAFAWGLLAVLGLARLGAHQARPGDPGHPVRHWPAESRVSRDATRPSLVLWLHPRCPCSWATLAELRRIVARGGDRAMIQAVFFRPKSASPGWEQTRLWHEAAAIPGVRVGVDPGGIEARRFGAATSGQVFLYDASGRLRFCGGITPSRGHDGVNPGRDAIVARLIGGDAGTEPAFVFGCPLAGPSESPVPGGSP